MQNNFAVPQSCSRVQELSDQLSQAHKDASEELRCVKRAHELHSADVETQLQQLTSQLQQQQQHTRTTDDPAAHPPPADENSRIAALEVRVQQLQDANLTLENALLQHYEGHDGEETVANIHQKRHSEVSAALEQRDAEMDALRAKLQVLELERVCISTLCGRVTARNMLFRSTCSHSALLVPLTRSGRCRGLLAMGSKPRMHLHTQAVLALLNCRSF